MATDTRNTGCARTPTSRRRLLSGAAAALTGAGLAGLVLSPDPTWGNPVEGRNATTLPNPDAHLLALCAKFHALHADAEATDPDVDADLTDALNRRHEVQHQIQPIRPSTAAGQAAKARVAMHLLDEAFGPRFPGDFLDFGLVTLAEIAGVAPPAELKDEHVVLAAPAVFPDAELLEACAAADAIQQRIDALWADPALVKDDKRRDPLVRALEEEGRVPGCGVGGGHRGEPG